VPKTAIHKNSSSSFRKDKVWLSKQFIVATPTSDAALSKQGNQPDFGASVTA
jgi:hypothetical protein